MPAKNKKITGNERLVSTNELCSLLGVEKSRISKWRTKLGLKPDKSAAGEHNKMTDYWSLRRVREWMIANTDVREVSETIENAGKEFDQVAIEQVKKIKSSKDSGFNAIIDRVSAAERAEFARYMSAIKNGDQLAIKSRRGAWLALVEQLRKLESDAPDVRKASGELVSREEAQAEMISMCMTVKQQMLSLKGSLPVLLVGMDEAEMSLLIDKAVRDACLALTVGGDGSKLIDKLIENKVTEIINEVRNENA